MVGSALACVYLSADTYAFHKPLLIQFTVVYNAENLRTNSETMIKNLFPILFVILFHSCDIQTSETTFYQIISKTHQQRCIDIPRASDRNNEQLYTWDVTDCQFNQLWKFEPVKDYFIIRSKYNNKVITAINGVIVQGDYENSKNQHWIVDKSNDTIFIISKTNGWVLTVSSQNELVLTKFDGSDAQKWYLKPSGLEYIKGDFNRELSPEEMKADIEYFFDKLKDTHVNPYAFATSDSLEIRKEKILDEIHYTLKRYEFNRLISSINGCFDGHTGLHDFDYSYYRTYLNNYGRILPFEFKYSPNHLYFDSEMDSLEHLEIISINNLPFSKISSEIENRENLELRHRRNAYIQRNISGFLFGLFDIESPYNIQVIDTISKKKSQFKVMGSTSFNTPSFNAKNKDPYSFRMYPDDAVAIIEYNTCDIRDRDIFNFYIDSVFSVINYSRIKHLFIDISRNGGGKTSNNNAFYKNINHLPNPWIENYVIKLNRETKLRKIGLSEEALDKVITHGNLSDYQKSVLESDIHEYEIEYCTDSVLNAYSNALYIIQSYWTYSAATDMSAWFKNSNIGTLIGCETGGPSEVYIDAKGFTLPNSKIDFRIAYKHSKYPNGKLNQGIVPDVDLGLNFYKEKYEIEDLKTFINKVISN